MSGVLDLKGRRFGKLTVVEQVKHRGGRVACKEHWGLEPNLNNKNIRREMNE